MHNTKTQRALIPRWVADYGILDIADIGAGDLGWIKQTKLGCAYRAFDLIPRHPEVQQFDLLTDPLPDADCYMVLWVLNHLTAEQARAASDKIMRSKARYLITTWREDYHNFVDATVLERCAIFGGAELRLIEL